MEENRNLSRRDFFKGTALGAAGLAVGANALGIVGGPSVARAEEQVAGESVYSSVFEQDPASLYVKKVDCPGPRGPVAFEGRAIEESEVIRTEECDILVVGAGIGGLIATLKAADEGAKVITLEKMTKGRGCFECFGAVDAQVQKDKGIVIDRAALLDELYRSAFWRTRPEPARTYVHRSGEATDFMQTMLGKGANGFLIDRVEQMPNTNGFPVFDSELGFYTSPSLPPDAAIRSGLSGIYVCQELAEIAKGMTNVDMRFSTPAVQLETDDQGRCTGCIAKDDDGYFRVSAAKGVILATGGYDANPEMMEAYCRPEDYASSSWWNPGWGTTGDGHMMGLQIGAQMDPVPQPVMNFRWGNPDSFFDARTWYAIWFAINVNAKGERYCNEDLPFQAVSNAQNAQPGYGANCWQIFDDTMFGFTDVDFAGMKEAIAEFEEKGWAFEASSPRELAEKCGIDPDGLEATISKFNTYQANGKDEDFNRFMGMAAPFTGSTYYALTTNSCILATVGGLTIDGNCNVMDINDAPIKGLYAVGNASGNFFSGNYPRHIPGTSIGRAITFAYVSAENAVKGA
ncbi:MAG: FAD-binding protein [Actinobacteria bacterium]|nr:FAD-binding protein [Actinomycetota bacterium]